MERTRLLDVTNVSARYPGSKKVILRDVDLTLYSGQITCVIGESGCGKSTVFRLLCRLHECTQGTIYLDGADIRQIYCNGATSWSLYEKYIRPVTGRSAVKLPSTSPANAAWSLPRLKEAWKVILEEL